MLDLDGDNCARFEQRDNEARAWHRAEADEVLDVLFDCLAAFEQLLRRIQELPEDVSAADRVLHHLLPDAYQALRAGATLISLGLYQPATRMARPLSEQWGIALFLTEHPGEVSGLANVANYPEAGKALTHLRAAAEASGNDRRLRLLQRVGELRREENQLQHVGPVAVGAGTHVVDGEQRAMLGSGRDVAQARRVASLLLRWMPGILATAARVSGADPGDVEGLRYLYKRISVAMDGFEASV